MFRCPKCKYQQSPGDGTGGDMPLWPSCGTGSTWTLTKCPSCAALFASPNSAISGGFVPDEVKKDHEVTICEFEDLVAPTRIRCTVPHCSAPSHEPDHRHVLEAVEVTFAPNVTPEQMAAALKVLGDLFEAAGGKGGLKIEAEIKRRSR